MIRDVLKPFLVGHNAKDVEAPYDAVQCRVRYVGRSSVASFAISAVYTALWDLGGKARSAARSGKWLAVQQMEPATIVAALTSISS
ncbi:MAG: hypothetical protein VX930_02295, partial [Pseudomonadota bacterium]|nr:hypothetical protein [Pseudomonadota bacterium]